MASKRKIELMDFESLKDGVSDASVKGAISSLSPIKKGRTHNYFKGLMSDGNAIVRLVGFSNSQQIKIKKIMDEQQSVQFDNCEIRKLRWGPKMEILLKDGSAITGTSTKFIPYALKDGTIHIDQLQSREQIESPCVLRL